MANFAALFYLASWGIYPVVINETGYEKLYRCLWNVEEKIRIADSHVDQLTDVVESCYNRTIIVYFLSRFRKQCSNQWWPYVQHIQDVFEHDEVQPEKLSCHDNLTIALDVITGKCLTNICDVSPLAHEEEEMIESFISEFISSDLLGTLELNQIIEPTRFCAPEVVQEVDDCFVHQDHGSMTSYFAKEPVRLQLGHCFQHFRTAYVQPRAETLKNKLIRCFCNGSNADQVINRVPKCTMPRKDAKAWVESRISKQCATVTSFFELFKYDC